jgi:hypothetical protein
MSGNPIFEGFIEEIESVLYSIFKPDVVTNPKDTVID